MSAVLIFIAFIPSRGTKQDWNVCFYLFELITGFNSPPVCACMALKNLLLPSFSEKRSLYSLVLFTPDVPYLRKCLCINNHVCVGGWLQWKRKELIKDSTDFLVVSIALLIHSRVWWECLMILASHHRLTLLTLSINFVSFSRTLIVRSLGALMCRLECNQNLSLIIDEASKSS